MSGVVEEVVVRARMVGMVVSVKAPFSMRLLEEACALFPFISFFCSQPGYFISQGLVL